MPGNAFPGCLFEGVRKPLRCIRGFIVDMVDIAVRIPKNGRRIQNLYIKSDNILKTIYIVNVTYENHIQLKFISYKSFSVRSVRTWVRIDKIQAYFFSL